MSDGRLPRLSARRIISALRRGGWDVVRTTGGHVQLRHPKRGGLVTVPMHGNDTIGPGLLDSILEQADLTIEEFRGLL